MIKIYFECPICGKKWIEMIDEHDVERYLTGKQYPDQPDGSFPVVHTFCCSGETRREYGDFEMKTPCNDCL